MYKFIASTSAVSLHFSCALVQYVIRCLSEHVYRTYISTCSVQRDTSVLYWHPLVFPHLLEWYVNCVESWCYYARKHSRLVIRELIRDTNVTNWRPTLNVSQCSSQYETCEFSDRFYLWTPPHSMIVTKTYVCILLKENYHFIGSNNLYFGRCLRLFGSNCYFHL
jgi:hypothetical protein